MSNSGYTEVMWAQSLLHHLCSLCPALCSVDQTPHILFHALPIYPHIPESGVTPCLNVLLCTELKLKVIFHVAAPFRSTTPAE